MKYRHTQFGHLMVFGLIGTMVAVVLLPFALGSFPPVLLLGLAVLAVSLALFYSLDVEINEGLLVCRFGIGLIRKQIPLPDIQDVRAVKNPWYVGWGIRWMPGQYWLWNVSGLRAVELLLKNGSRFRVGTDEPDALVMAIKAKIG